MYRVLLKSMKLVAPDDKDCDPRRSCREGQNLNLPTKTEQEPGLMATYPIGPPSTIDPALGDLSFTAFSGGISGGVPPVVLAILRGYLGIRRPDRNAPSARVPAAKPELSP
jgi:hypothetical protein